MHIFPSQTFLLSVKLNHFQSNGPFKNTTFHFQKHNSEHKDTGTNVLMSSKHQSCGLSWQTHLEQKTGEKRQPVPTLRWKSSLKSTMPGKLRKKKKKNSEWTAVPRIVLYHEQAHDSNVNHTQRLGTSGSEWEFKKQSRWCKVWL